MYKNNLLIEKQEIKGIDWIPRGFFIFVGSLFFLMSVDVFFEDYTILETIGALIMHMIPGFIILGIIKLTWRKDFISFVFFFILGIFGLFFFNPPYHLIYGILILSMSVIYLISWFLQIRKIQNNKEQSVK